MRHKVFGARLSRDTNARKALLKNLASALVINGKITTTLAKAKFARGYIEKLVTFAKSNKLSLHRKIASSLTSEALKKLIGEIGPGFAARPGGYIRIIKLEQRSGDAAKMAKLEFLEWEKTPLRKSAKLSKMDQAETKGNQLKPARPAGGSVIDQRQSVLNSSRAKPMALSETEGSRDRRSSAKL